MSGGCSIWWIMGMVSGVCRMCWLMAVVGGMEVIVGSVAGDVLQWCCTGTLRSSIVSVMRQVTIKRGFAKIRYSIVRGVF